MSARGIGTKVAGELTQSCFDLFTGIVNEFALPKKAARHLERYSVLDKNAKMD
tara:strand:+ start:1067 stop:1225 length:159 start_codon:yes stop_codon:yes gene_type:complete